MLLNLHSYYSLRYGTLSLKDLLSGMQVHGYDTAVLTDINNSTGVLDLVREGAKAGVRILGGMEFRDGDELLFVCIAKNTHGFQEINEYLTGIQSGREKFSRQAPEFRNVFVIYPHGAILADRLRDFEYVGIRPHERHRVRLASHREMERYVILATVSFRRSEYKLHRQLRAIDHNMLISQLEPEQIGRMEEVFVSKDRLLAWYRDMPMLIANTERMLGACSFDFDFTTKRNKATFTGSRSEDHVLLQRYAEEGLIKRYGTHHAEAKARIRHELDSIAKQDFSAYYLITNDICRHAQNLGIGYVGRGSGANSAVAYCIGITEVDPLELRLPFERFLNPKRKSPPDFDVDFSWRDRDVMYDYIFQTHQQNHVALLGAMSTFQSRSIIRELGKIYGLPKSDIDRLVHEPSHILNKNEVTETILGVTSQVADFPNQRTIHASGVLISERPLTCYSALDYPPKGLPTVQFDMYAAEHIGLDKFDILSQRGIGHIKDCPEIIRQNRGVDVCMDDPKRFFKDDKVAAQLRSANTIGCFYIESPAMRQLLTKLCCEDYLTLVAASSIIRPGVAGSGMMGEYIKRHHDPSLAMYLHPVFKEQLGETYGVMVYQEDVMTIANVYGGLDMGDADVLRRMMTGKKDPDRVLEKIERRFFANCAAKGYEEAVSREVWRQMESFAGYSFNKAHSASYAVESYQSLYLKTYFPLEFMVSVLNNYGGFYRRKVYVNEAKTAGAKICLPCVNKSVYNTTIYGEDIYLGFDCLQHLESKLAEQIPKERALRGEYRSLYDFVQRTQAGLEQLVVLIRVGAFHFLDIGKKELLWEAHLMMGKHKPKSDNGALFDVSLQKPRLPVLDSDVLEDYYDELELIGFCVSGTMFDMTKSSYRGDVLAKDLVQHEGKVVRMVGEFVAEKRVHTKRREQMKFGTFFDVEGRFFDTVHFPPSLERYPLLGDGIYLIEGKVTVDFSCPAVEVIRCAKMSLKPDPRSL